MAFNVLVRNTDDHPRNHAFLPDGEMLALSPAFDLLPALIRPGVGTSFSLAMTCGPRGREGALDNVLAAAPRFGLSPGQARGIADRLAETVSAWRDHFEECRVTPAEIEALAPSFAAASIR